MMDRYNLLVAQDSVLGSSAGCLRAMVESFLEVGMGILGNKGRMC